MRPFNFSLTILLIILLNLNFAIAGGGIHLGGGGNTTTLTPISKEEIQSKLQYYHQYRQELITTLRLVGLSAKRVLAIQSQLSQPLDNNEKSTAEFQALLYDHIFNQSFDEKRVAHLKLNFITNGECVDILGNQSDASVLSTDLNTICFNLNRLNEKLGQENYEVELIALYIHELTHCFGSTEEDGNAIQESIRSLGIKFKEYLTFLDPNGIKIKNSLNEIIVQLNALDLKNNKIAKICTSLTPITHKIFSLLQTESAKSTGQSALGFNGVIYFHAAYVVSSFLNDACDPLLMIRKQIKFKKSKQLKVKELYPDPTMLLTPAGIDLQIKLSSYLLADLSDATLVAPQFGDKVSLTTNLNELKRLLVLALK